MRRDIGIVAKDKIEEERPWYLKVRLMGLGDHRTLGSAAAREMLTEIFHILPAHWRSDVDEEATMSDLSGVHVQRIQFESGIAGFGVVLKKGIRKRRRNERRELLLALAFQSLTEAAQREASTRSMVKNRRRDEGNNLSSAKSVEKYRWRNEGY